MRCDVYEAVVRTIIHFFYFLSKVGAKVLAREPGKRVPIIKGLVKLGKVPTSVLRTVIVFFLTPIVTR